MSRRKRDGPPSFEEWTRTGSGTDAVRPLAGRDKLRPPPEPAPAAPRAAREAAPIRFDVERVGERIEGRARGVDRRQLLRLRRGELEVEMRVDLHRHRSDAARRALRQALEGAAGAGRRCVLVIHGRGRHSGGASVLKDALPGWLAEPPLDRLVMAFATAHGRDGGAGATYVLLRRRR